MIPSSCHLLFLTIIITIIITTQTIHPLFGPDVVEVWSYETSVERKNAAGGTAKASVLAQIDTVRKYVASLQLK